MLTIIVPPTELWDGLNECFIPFKGCTLQLEHSLVSISKWESKWEKAFYSSKSKTNEEVIDYVKCMTITHHVPNYVYKCLTPENFKQIDEYINSRMTATWFADDDKKSASRETITSELIYYWMAAFDIPFEPCQKWHINRLFTLIKICNIKNQPPKKMSKRDTMSKYAALNAARRKQFNTRG